MNIKKIFFLKEVQRLTNLPESQKKELGFLHSFWFLNVDSDLFLSLKQPKAILLTVQTQ